MYQVLPVDDEPLILSGIKFMLDWNKNNCQIAGTARNGQQAMEKIRTLHPDIVICDIAMPGMTGTELLQQTAKEFPHVVFIMLTNHPDFQMAQHSLRYRAVDYLLKSDLEPEALERSLAAAQAECRTRAKLNRVEMVDDYLEHNCQNMLEKAFLSLMQSQPGYANENAVELLAENGALQNYAIAYLVMDFSAVSGWKDFSPEERAKTFEWVRELCREVAQNTFPENALFSANTPAQSQTLFLLCWQLETEAWKSRLRIFAEKAGAACRTIAKTELAVMGTSCFAGPESLESCRRQLFGLRDNYYYFGSNAMFYEDFAPVKWGSLALGGIGDRLQTEINAKNAAACELLLKRAIDRVSTVPHQQSQALWLCGGIYSAAAAFLEIDTAKGRQSIEQLATRQQVLEWLELIKTELSARMGQCDPAGRTALLEKARQYVLDNVDKRIMLQDVADHICISPGYLSALFKKQYDQTLVEFINEQKCRRASELIRQGQYRIYEISYMLGFENAYYFTRVFKRYLGMTPTEYQKKHATEKG